MSIAIESSGRKLALCIAVVCCTWWALGTKQSFAHDKPHQQENLRQAVIALQQAVNDVPTTIENVDDRLETFWRWANAYALSDLPIDPDVPATVARIRDPGPKEDISMLDLADIDRWVREFSYREKHPKAIGSLSSPRLNGYEVDAFHELEINYTVGARALTAGDGFVLGELTYGKGPLLQARDPQADDFVSIKTADSNVVFEVEGYPIRGMFSGTMKRSVVMTGPAQKVFLRIKEGRLDPGSKVTITLGDQTYGSRGLGLIAPSIDALRFRVWLHLEAEQLLMSMPELQFSSVGGAVAGVRGFAPSIVGPNEPLTLTIRFEDQFRNLATGEMPAADVMQGEKLIARIPAGGPSLVSLPEISFSSEGVQRLRISSTGDIKPGDVNPILVKRNPSVRLYWGETHGHSGFSEGMGSVDGVYEFARDQARLDFMALTEHDYWMDDAEWETLRRAAIEHNEPGEFLAFLAYEWTVHSPNGGHHNILFRTPHDRKRVPRQEVQTLPELYSRLAEVAEEEDMIVIPHAHNPGDWALNDAQTEKFVEIVSLHGTFEWFGRNYLDQGFMVGFLGGSDDHMGHPGLRPLRRNPTSDNFGGLLGLYAPAKTNDAVFDAIRDIRGYATNGVRSILELELNNQSMGSYVEPARTATFSGQVHGTAPIEEVVLIKNGQAVKQIDFSQTQESGAELVEIRFWSDSYPRHKGALARQWRRWRGSVNVSGGTLDHVESPQNDNPFTEFSRVREGSDDIVDFFLKTRGSFKSILLDVSERSGDASLLLSGIKESPLPQEAMRPFEFAIDLSELDERPVKLDLPMEGYDDHVLIRRVSKPESMDVSLAFSHDQPARVGDYYYLRIRQSDGGLIWSSPFRVGTQ